MRAAALLGIGFLLGCSLDGPTGGPVVQIVTTEAFPHDRQCGLVNPDFSFLVHMVNTTSSDVVIDSIGTRGVVLRAGSDDLLGKPAYVLSSIPYTPTPALLRAHDGDITVKPDMNAPCLVGLPLGPILPSFVDVSLTLLVFTNAGLFTSLPQSLHHTF